MKRSFKLLSILMIVVILLTRFGRLNLVEASKEDNRTKVDRIFGKNRIETAIEISKKIEKSIPSGIEEIEDYTLKYGEETGLEKVLEREIRELEIQRKLIDEEIQLEKVLEKDLKEMIHLQEVK